MLNNNSQMLLKTDEELVGLVIKDELFFRYLVDRYTEKLGRYIRRTIIVTKEDEEDILQEVFIKTYTYINDFDPTLKFSSWIYRIAHNEAISFLRKNKDRLSTLHFEANDKLVETLRSDLNIEKEIDRKYFMESIRKVIDGFKNSDYRDVLILRYIEDMDYREISDILKKPMGTVATLLNRAKEQFRKELLNNKKIDIK